MLLIKIVSPSFVTLLTIQSFYIFLTDKKKADLEPMSRRVLNTYYHQF